MRSHFFILDFVDFTNGKYCAGVVAFVSITVKNFDIHRENIGYATSVAANKGMAIYKSRKVSFVFVLEQTDPQTLIFLMYL